MDWFRHDIYAQQDIKLRKLILHHGYEAYGLYWHAMEMLYQNDGEMDLSDFEEMFAEYDGIVSAFVSYGLIFLDGDKVFSNRVKKEIEFNSDMKRKRSEAGKKGMESRWKNNNVITNDNSVITQPNTIPDLTIKKDISLSNDSSISKEKNRASKFVKPSLEEVENYCKERNNGIEAQAFIDHYESNGWKVGKNPMKDWKAAVRTWERGNYRSSRSSQEPTKHKDYSDVKPEDFDLTNFKWSV